MNIQHLKLFVRLANTQNISLAGQELGLSPAVASAHIIKLEQDLGVRLVHRTTRKVSLTQEGQVFLPHAEDVLTSVEVARNAIGTGMMVPTGILKVTAPSSFGRMHLLPGLKGFMTQYPEITVDFRFSDSIVDVVEGGYDIAIRNADLKDSTLIAKKLAPDNRIICASPDYLAEHGEPQSPKDLSQHQCINLIGLEYWIMRSHNGPIGIKTSGQFKTDNGEAVREACSDGLGISINSTWSVYKHLKEGRLKHILSDYPLVSDTAIWAVYPSARLVAPKIRAFINYYADYFGKSPYWDDIISNHSSKDL